MLKIAVRLQSFSNFVHNFIIRFMAQNDPLSLTLKHTMYRCAAYNFVTVGLLLVITDRNAHTVIGIPSSCTIRKDEIFIIPRHDEVNAQTRKVLVITMLILPL